MEILTLSLALTGMLFLIFFILLIVLLIAPKKPPYRANMQSDIKKIKEQII